MAFVTSLGLHVPAALEFLIAESILPQDPPQDLYSWETYNSDTEEIGEEDLVTTEHCVVWSRGGVVQRIFKFDLEGDKIRQALLTWFTAHGSPKTTRGAKSDLARLAQQADGSPSHVEPEQSSRSPPTWKPRSPDNLSRALVVIVKHQAHIFFLHGPSHVVNLPFEVERAFPAPRGVLLQRKLPMLLLVPPTPMPPSVPQNSFVLSQNHAWSSPNPRTAPTRTDRHKTSPNPSKTPNNLADFVTSAMPQAVDDLPGFFSLTDPLAEIGRVVEAFLPLRVDAAPESQYPTGSTLRAIGREEELLYISPTDETPAYLGGLERPLILVLTFNRAKKHYTLWSASYVETKSILATKRESTIAKAVMRSRRRSSYAARASVGVTTPNIRNNDSTRDSFMRSFLGQPSFGVSQQTVSRSSEGGNLESVLQGVLALQSEVDVDSTGPAIANTRRTTSLLARAELSSHDPNTFSDLARNTSGPAGSFHSISRRGPSFGGPTDRGSFSRTRLSGRASVAGSISRLSDVKETAAQECIEDDTMEDFIAFGDYEVSNLLEPFEGLKNELVMTRLSSITTEDFSTLSGPANLFRSDTVKVLTLPAPGLHAFAEGNIGNLSILMINRERETLTELLLSIRRVESHAEKSSSANKPATPGDRYVMIPSKEVRCRSLKYIVDAITITDGNISRLVVLGKSDSGEYRVQLAANWPDASIQENDLTELLQTRCLRLQVPWETEICDSRSRKYQPFVADADNFIPAAGVKQSPMVIQKLRHAGRCGRFDCVDVMGRHYRIQVQMQPRNGYVAKILDVCRFLPLKLCNGEEGLLELWWNICRDQRCGKPETEWIGCVTALFSLFVCHIKHDIAETLPTAPSSITAQHSSTSPIPTADHGMVLHNLFAMMDNEQHGHVSSNHWVQDSAWQWIDKSTHRTMATEAIKLAGNVCSGFSNLQTCSTSFSTWKNRFMIDCTQLARQYLSSRTGSAEAVLRGMLPTAELPDEHHRGQGLAKLLFALHLLREEEKLDITSEEVCNTASGSLGPVLAQIGHWIGWESWSWKPGAFFSLDDPVMGQYLFDDSSITDITIPACPGEPPSIFDWLESCLGGHSLCDFPTLAAVNADQGTSENDSIRYNHALCSKLTPRTSALKGLIQDMQHWSQNLSLPVEAMVRHNIDVRTLETFPEAIAALLRSHVVCNQVQPPTTWPQSMLNLVSRQDLAMLLGEDPNRSGVAKLVPLHSHQDQSVKDVHSLCQTLEDDIPVSVGIQDARNPTFLIDLIYRTDRRFYEALKLLEATRQQVREIRPKPGMTEAAFLDEELLQAHHVYQRTLGIPAGDALAGYNCHRPLLTEHIKVTTFNTSCRMQPSGHVANADRNQFTEEKVGWAFFHAGVNIGLRIAREASGIDTTWLVLNKPAELGNRHAGFLLALGLNGHLKSIAKWLAFKYLTPKHDMTSIGLLLGLSASYLGTMDSLVTRLLSVHVVRLLPPGAAELNVSPLTQTAGMMSIGLLYYNSQHRRMSEVMISEIEHIEVEDPAGSPDTFRDEGYRLAAGFALGLINLAQGKDLHKLRDMRVVERLLSVAIGSRNIEVVHILDQARAGATIAIALIFLKTGDEALASKIDVPSTTQQLDYVRSDILALRIVAKNLIMWNHIEPTNDWIMNGIPVEYRQETVDQSFDAILGERPQCSSKIPIYNILAGLFWSLALKHAGTGSLPAKNLLLTIWNRVTSVLDHTYATNFDQCLTRNTLDRLEHLLALSAATVMAGTGDLDVFRRLRKFHATFNGTTTFGFHQATHQAMGALFLGQGKFTFSTSNIAVASLLCAFYPIFPKDALDNRAHLQALRHFWVFAAEPRCLVTMDVEMKQPIVIPVAVILHDGTRSIYETPCLLPELETIARVETMSPEHWGIVLDFAGNPAHLDTFKKHQMIFLRRKSLLAQYGNVFSATLAELIEAPPSIVNRNKPDLFEWIVHLPIFAQLGIERTEMLGILPRIYGSTADHEFGSANTMLPVDMLLDIRTTKVDDFLVLTRSVRNPNADRLKGLEALLAWAEREKRSGRSVEWIEEPMLERLRIGVFMMRGGQEQADQKELAKSVDAETEGHTEVQEEWDSMVID